MEVGGGFVTPSSRGTHGGQRGFFLASAEQGRLVTRVYPPLSLVGKQTHFARKAVVGAILRPLGRPFDPRRRLRWA